MRYELADFEWASMKPMLPNKPRGAPRVNDRRMLPVGEPKHLTFLMKCQPRNNPGYVRNERK